MILKIKNKKSLKNKINGILIIIMKLIKEIQIIILINQISSNIDINQKGGQVAIINNSYNYSHSNNLIINYDLAKMEIKIILMKNIKFLREIKNKIKKIITLVITLIFKNNTSN